MNVKRFKMWPLLPHSPYIVPKSDKSKDKKEIRTKYSNSKDSLCQKENKTLKSLYYVKCLKKKSLYL